MAAVVLWAATAAAEAACEGPEIGAGKVALVRDGRTLVLDDKREVRLAGIEIAESDGQTAKQALEALVLGRDISIKRIQNIDGSVDRYGRLTGLVFAGGTGPAQAALLAAGAAQVSANADNCARPFQNIERQARSSGVGLWKVDGHPPLPADVLGVLAANKGRFALVEGKAVSVNDRGAVIYVNFSRRWSQGLTLTILKRNQRIFSQALGLAPKQLEGKRILVRGVLEQRLGPTIEAQRPEQIELVD